MCGVLLPPSESCPRFTCVPPGRGIRRSEGHPRRGWTRLREPPGGGHRPAVCPSSRLSPWSSAVHTRAPVSSLCNFSGDERFSVGETPVGDGVSVLRRRSPLSDPSSASVSNAVVPMRGKSTAWPCRRRRRGVRATVVPPLTEASPLKATDGAAREPPEASSLNAAFPLEVAWGRVTCKSDGSCPIRVTAFERPKASGFRLSTNTWTRFSP